MITPLKEYQSGTYDLTIQRLKDEQEAKKTPLQLLLAKGTQPTKKHKAIFL